MNLEFKKSKFLFSLDSKYLNTPSFKIILKFSTFNFQTYLKILRYPLSQTAELTKITHSLS